MSGVDRVEPVSECFICGKRDAGLQLSYIYYGSACHEGPYDDEPLCLSCANELVGRIAILSVTDESIQWHGRAVSVWYERAMRGEFTPPPRLEERSGLLLLIKDTNLYDLINHLVELGAVNPSLREATYRMVLLNRWVYITDSCFLRSSVLRSYVPGDTMEEYVKGMEDG